ncbi:recombinase family protein [Solirubrobacter sp. CPCC 204708]|uniref:Recombinase family protein n=1 Tax=Solirubrobacter deserti TaxID=2282478 RepID=A0ABT4RF77_9ACTN|nr:recombinase family protein [Solirubrobacter deserti]MBE2319507.1 recombinase family protein [Solirubrobacter deserti]MDA0137206.1 recombinase family protein [Solirubrobacter deserti]
MAIALLFSADGVGASLLGAPAWLALLYVALGLALATLRLRFARRPSAPAEAAAAAEPAPVAPLPARRRAIGYVCLADVSNGALEAHTAAVTACCEARGLQLLTVVHDIDAAGRDQRPSLAWALEQLADGKAEALVVGRLRDLSANVANLPPLLTWFNDEDRRLIAVDLELDTSTEAGQLAASAVAGVGGWEHEKISERTRRGLEAARARGNGNGRTSVADVPELQERIAGMRANGMTLQAIADVLNSEGVPTLRGGTMWRPSSVQRATGYRRPSNSRGIELPKR